MSPVPDDALVLRRHGTPIVEEVEVDGETVVYDSRSGSLHLLDPVGSLIWAALDGVTTLGEVSDELARVFGGRSSDVHADVTAFADRLLDLDLVDRVAGS
ncbi:PqqD family protein [Nocardioides mesophilus]|uniref:PqqD family protein n=1 Tax=Nocardioides mesophilus TaxID=433659 RepID=A0A7G9R986_9ACTN|nr:PqqD family protein [Nocardioides mesophilus]QNN52161.1 PqqD family protein [Nocardioides mesophilus]